MSKFISRNTLTTVGDMISFSTTIDETKHGNSYLEFPELLWDFQKYFVTLFKTGLGTSRVQFNQWGGLNALKCSYRSYKKFWMSQTWNPIPNKKVMIKSVILYRLGKELFEQCDIKSLEFVYQKLVSTRAHKTSCMFLYRYKVTKKINYDFFYGYIEPNWPYTVWNFAKCNSVTFWKFFRIVKFLIKMLI